MSCLPNSQKEAVLWLICGCLALFSDMLQHETDVVDNAPIKRYPYHVNPIKGESVHKGVEYLLSNGLTVSSTACLLLPKVDLTPRFCTDYGKVNRLTKPDSFPLSCVEDCIDRVGQLVM